MFGIVADFQNNGFAIRVNMNLFAAQFDTHFESVSQSIIMLWLVNLIHPPTFYLLLWLGTQS